MLRIERPPRWPLTIEPVSGLVGRPFATSFRLPIKYDSGYENPNQFYRCGGSVGLTPTSRLPKADQRELDTRT